MHKKTPRTLTFNIVMVDGSALRCMGSSLSFAPSPPPRIVVSFARRSPIAITDS
jgi:hypothetical protein